MCGACEVARVYNYIAICDIAECPWRFVDCADALCYFLFVVTRCVFNI